MKLKGTYNPEKQYEPDDIVLMEGNALAYKLMHPAPAGTPPTNTQFWTTLDQNLSQCAWLIVSYQQPQEPDKEYVNPKPTRKKKEAN